MVFCLEHTESLSDDHLDRLDNATSWLCYNQDQTLFNYFQESKVIRDLISFALLCTVIGLECSHHPLHRSDVKLTPSMTLAFVFSRAQGDVHAF